MTSLDRRMREPVFRVASTDVIERERRRRVDEQIVEALEKESTEVLSLLDVDTFHLGGQHSQKSHGRGGSSGVSGKEEPAETASGDAIRLSDNSQ